VQFTSRLEKKKLLQRESLAMSAQERLKNPQKNKQKNKQERQSEEAIGEKMLTGNVTLLKLVGGGKKSMNLSQKRLLGAMPHHF
jgi:hypothetical protein